MSGFDQQLQDEASAIESPCEDEDEEPEISYGEAIIWLAILTLWISVLSGYLVDAIQVFFFLHPDS